MGCICCHNLYPTISGTRQSGSEPFLVAPFEQGLIVFHKSIVCVSRDVRWVRKYEISSFSLIDNLLEIRDPKFGTPEQRSTRGEVVGVHNNRRFRPLWHVELTSQIDAVHSVEASSVQVERASSSFHRIDRHTVTYTVVVRLAVFFLVL